MQPTDELIADMYRRRVLRARATPPDQKLVEGFCLFELACNMTAAGIRQQFSDADDNRVREILSQRLAWRGAVETCAVNAEQAAAAVIQALDAVAVPYMLVGSLSNYRFLPAAASSAMTSMIGLVGVAGRARCRAH
jgi:hypothetical protein